MNAIQSLDEDAELTGVPGIGAHYEARIAQAGFTSIQELAVVDLDQLARCSGLSPTPFRTFFLALAFSLQRAWVVLVCVASTPRGAKYRNLMAQYSIISATPWDGLPVGPDEVAQRSGDGN